MPDLKIIDAWMQHPTKRFSEQPMFDSLKRWNKSSGPMEGIPLEWTIMAMDQGQVSKGLLCSWYSPLGDLISNEEVAAMSCWRREGRLSGMRPDPGWRSGQGPS